MFEIRSQQPLTAVNILKKARKELPIKRKNYYKKNVCSKVMSTKIGSYCKQKAENIWIASV